MQAQGEEEEDERKGSPMRLHPRQGGEWVGGWAGGHWHWHAVTRTRGGSKEKNAEKKGGEG